MLPYRGRFAPSPTGPLHFGSLVAALGSCLEARARSGRWLVRMEDVDEPRCRRETADAILRQIAALGFEWDGEVLWQSRRTARYREALEALRAAGHVYPCACTRREIADSALAPDGSLKKLAGPPQEFLGPLGGEPSGARFSGGAHVYPGTCRNGLAPGKIARAWRLAVPSKTICFDDAVQGRLCQDMARDAGDFVLLRADGYFAYQLAVVVDDADQGITHIVRGADLVDSTPRQILLQRLLGVPTPAYAHLPAAVNAAGEKLSKQTGAAPLDPGDPVPALVAALDFLGQKPPGDLERAGVAEIWGWARAHWTLARVSRTKALSAVVAAAVAGDADQQPHG